MRPKLFRILVAGILLMFSCTLSDSPPQSVELPDIFGPDPTDTPYPGNIVMPAEGEITPTPFLPIDPTARAATPTVIPTAAWGDFEGPTLPASIAIPPPVEEIAQPADQVNFLLMGSDQRPDDSGFRTDTIVLVTLSPSLGKVSLTSFPRDLYVYIPGWTMQRINTAQPHGGFNTTQDTFHYNFGVKPDYYALINFGSFVQVVDSLGGINVNVHRTLTDQRDGHGDYTIEAGRATMDGETALWYVRSRYTSSDFDRNRRQQEVLIAIFYRIISLNGIQRAPELYNLFKDNVFTNAAYSDLTPFAGLAADVASDSSIISSYAITGNQVSSFRTPNGAAVLLPNYDLTTETMKKALNAP